MLEKFEEMEKQMNELMNLILKETITVNSMKYMDEATVKAWNVSMELFNTSMELSKENIKMIEDMNKKLDKILEKIK